MMPLVVRELYSVLTAALFMYMYMKATPLLANAYTYPFWFA
jgi:hypothetical protein